MNTDEPEEATTSKEEVTELDTEVEENTLSEEDMDKIKKDYWTFTSIDYWGYLSYFLLFLFFPLVIVFPSFSAIALANVIVIISFSRYIYLMKNDDEYEFSFFNQSSYLAVMFQITLFLCAIWATVIGLLLLTIIFADGCLAPNGYVNSCDELIRISLLATMLWLFAFSLSFKKKVLKAADDDSEGEVVDDTPKVGLGSNLLQVILGLSAFLVFIAGLYAGYSGWGDGTDGLPCYSISFILLVCMLALGLRAQGPSQEPLEIEKIKVLNWMKFKTRMVVLVVVFSLILGPMWYNANKDYSIEYNYLDEDCIDEIVGPNVNLTNVDFSGMYLYGCDLSNRNLTGADFSSTYLRCVDFSNSILVGADFGSTSYVDSYGDTLYREATDIHGVTFDNADLSDANFNGLGYLFFRNPSNYVHPEAHGYDVQSPCGSENISFRGANLTNADIDARFWNKRGGNELIFDNAILDKANFAMTTSYTQVSMVNVSFIGTDLSTSLPPGSDLSQSNMSQANFIDFLALDLSSCPLSLPKTYNCAEISGKKMIFGPGMDFSNKYISYTDANSLGTTGPGVNFSGLYLPNSIFHGVLLNGSDMSNTNLSNSNFTYSHKIYNEQYLDYSHWVESTDEENRSYIDNMLEEWGVDNFSGFKSLWSANLVDVDFTGSNLSYSDFSYSNMTNANLENATLTGAKWYYTTCPDGTNSGKTGICSTT